MTLGEFLDFSSKVFTFGGLSVVFVSCFCTAGAMLVGSRLVFGMGTAGAIAGLICAYIGAALMIAATAVR